MHGTSSIRSTLQEFVPLKRAPSTSLADMYRLSLTEPAPSADGQHLRLGDLYVQGTQNALLVINADCDLVHSSQSPSRQFRPDMSILLLPGCLTPVDESPKQGFKVTQLFGLDGQAYKIVWRHERLITKKYGEVVKWLTCEGFVKKARLTAAHALEIQHHFAASLTRVGCLWLLRFLDPLPYKYMQRTKTVHRPNSEQIFLVEL